MAASPKTARARSVGQRAAIVVLVCALCTAAFADCLAGSRAIVLADRDGLSLFKDAPASGVDWALFPPVRHDPHATRSAGQLRVLESPSSEHLLGTDDRGRDVLSRLIHGTRSTLWLAFLSTLSATLLALALVFVSTGHRLADLVVQTFCDALAAIPVVLLVVLLRGLVWSTSLWLLVLLIAVPRAGVTARVLREGVRAALASEYCEAARAMGASPQRVFWRHALPACLPQLWVAAALTAAVTVVAEVALSFLGLGLPASMPSWGELLRQAHENQLHWWLLAPVGGCAALVSWALGRLAQRDP